MGQEAYQKFGWKAESAEDRAEGGVEVRTWAMVRAYLPPAGSASHPAACARASTGYSQIEILQQRLAELRQPGRGPADE